MNTNNVEQTRQQKIEHLLATTPLGNIKQVTIVGDLFCKSQRCRLFNSPWSSLIKNPECRETPIPDDRFTLDNIETLLMMEAGVKNSYFGQKVLDFSAARSKISSSGSYKHGQFLEALKMFYRFEDAPFHNAMWTTPTVLHQDLEKITALHLGIKQKVSAYRSVLKDYGIKLNYYHRISHLDFKVARAIHDLAENGKNPVRLNDVFLAVNSGAHESIITYKASRVRRSLERLKHMGIIKHGERVIFGIEQASFGAAGWYIPANPRYNVL